MGLHSHLAGDDGTSFAAIKGGNSPALLHMEHGSGEGHTSVITESQNHTTQPFLAPLGTAESGFVDKRGQDMVSEICLR